MALRREPTGASEAWRGDVAATAKRALRAGEVLDGEGGAMVWGKCVPAARSLRENLLPIGLAHGVRLVRDVAAGAVLRQPDVALDLSHHLSHPGVALRRGMEAAARGAVAA